MRIRRLIQQEFRRILTNIDVLIAPARMGVAPKVTQPLDAEPSPPPPPDRKAGMHSIIGASNLAGLPALSLPCGFAEGLPVALQLVSRPFTENLILSLGMTYQKVTDWHRQRPKV
jgi:aspartyl-tRNA(Asn)/glutamyl-tRNA(Gln) amidotransferase subunit A